MTKDIKVSLGSGIDPKVGKTIDYLLSYFSEKQYTYHDMINICFNILTKGLGEFFAELSPIAEQQFKEAMKDSLELAIGQAEIEARVIRKHKENKK